MAAIWYYLCLLWAFGNYHNVIGWSTGCFHCSCAGISHFDSYRKAIKVNTVIQQLRMIWDRGLFSAICHSILSSEVSVIISRVETSTRFILMNSVFGIAQLMRSSLSTDTYKLKNKRRNEMMFYAYKPLLKASRIFNFLADHILRHLFFGYEKLPVLWPFHHFF